MLCAHGPEVEWRICTIWEAAYGLLPLSSSAVDLPEIVVATPLQPPSLSWSLYRPLLKVLEYLPRGSPSEACLMRIFVATVEAILRRTFPLDSLPDQRKKKIQGSWSTELRTMIHSLFLESSVSTDLASRLIFVVLTVCVSYEVLPNGSKRTTGDAARKSSDDIPEEVNGGTSVKIRSRKKQGPVTVFDSFVLAAVCALSCELQLFPLIMKKGRISKPKNSNENSVGSAISHTRRILRILEAHFSLKPSSIGTSWGCSSNEIVAAAMVAAHVSELFRQSKACMNSLSILMRCKWDPEISNRSSSLYHLIDFHGKAVASIVDKAEPLEAHLVQVPLWKVTSDNRGRNSNKRHIDSTNFGGLEKKQNSALQNGRRDGSCNSGMCRDKTELLLNSSASKKNIARLAEDASDLANFLIRDRHIGLNCSAQAFLRSVLQDRNELCFSVVSLLWHKLIATPETEMCAESTSAQQGWSQVNYQSNILLCA